MPEAHVLGVVKGRAQILYRWVVNPRLSELIVNSSHIARSSRRSRRPHPLPPVLWQRSRAHWSAELHSHPDTAAPKRSPGHSFNKYATFLKLEVAAFPLPEITHRIGAACFRKFKMPQQDDLLSTRFGVRHGQLSVPQLRTESLLNIRS
jgi:hypothetical protein